MNGLINFVFGVNNTGINNFAHPLWQNATISFPHQSDTSREFCTKQFICTLLVFEMKELHPKFLLNVIWHIGSYFIVIGGPYQLQNIWPDFGGADNIICLLLLLLSVWIIPPNGIQNARFSALQLVNFFICNVM